MIKRVFGIPKKEKNKVELYEGQAKLIIKAAPTNKGETYKFELTKQALIDLNLLRSNADDEKLVSFSFEDDKLIIGNTTSLKGQIDSKAQYNVSMSGIFSNKKIHEYITNLLELEPKKDNVLDVIMIEGDEDDVDYIAELKIYKTKTNVLITTEGDDSIPQQVNTFINDNLTNENENIY